MPSPNIMHIGKRKNRIVIIMCGAVDNRWITEQTHEDPSIVAKGTCPDCLSIKDKLDHVIAIERTGYDTMSTKKKPVTKRGRPLKYEMPERIDASPEEIAQVVLRAKPKKKWRYMEVVNRPR